MLLIQNKNQCQVKEQLGTAIAGAPGQTREERNRTYIPKNSARNPRAAVGGPQLVRLEVGADAAGLDDARLASGQFVGCRGLREGGDRGHGPGEGEGDGGGEMHDGGGGIGGSGVDVLKTAGIPVVGS